MLASIYSNLERLSFKNIKGLLPQKLWNLLSPAGKRQVIQRRDCYPTFTNACKALTDKVGANNIGDYLEFGVWEGNTLICMFQALTDLKLTHVRLFGFDFIRRVPRHRRHRY